MSLGVGRHGMRIGLLVAAVAAGCASCSGDGGPAAQERNTQLKEGAVARVGEEWIEAETVVRIAAAQRISLAEARSKAIHDALFAEHARQSGLGSDPRVLVEQRGVLAEAFLGALRREAARTPSTPEEIARVTGDHWLDLDRPEARRAVHAVVRVTESDTPQKVKAAQELAQRIATAVKGVGDPGQFIEAAKKVPAEGLEVVAEKLSPVTRDSRVADLEKRPEPGQPPVTFDPLFTEAVWKLEKVGEQLGPMRSSFGWHVLMLVAIQPGHHVPPDRLAKMLRDEIVSLRAKQALDRELQQAQTRSAIRIERNAISITEVLQQEGARE